MNIGTQVQTNEDYFEMYGRKVKGTLLDIYKNGLALVHVTEQEGKAINDWMMDDVVFSLDDIRSTVLS